MLERRTLLAGLTAQYFDRVDFTDLKLTRTDSRVNFNWGTLAPDVLMGTDDFAVRWTGLVQPQFSENYTFYVASDDGARLWVDGRLIIDNWVNQSATEKSATLPLVAGKSYDIRLDYYDATSNASVVLSWSSPSVARQVIPSSRLLAQGAGMAATFFDNADFTGASVSRTDATVNFNWGSGSPDPAISPTSFSARWSGQIVPQYTQPYSFYVTADTGATAKLRVDGQLVVDSASIQDSGEIRLEAGKRYDVQLDYSHSSGNANVKLEWSSPSQARQTIPGTRMWAGKVSSIPGRYANYTNSVNDLDRPDPGVIWADGYYWMTHTTGGPSSGWPLLRSSDLTGGWTFVKHLLDSTNKPAFMTDAFWAPEIHKVNGKYVITGTSYSSTYGRLVIAIGTASEITGPYTVRTTPIVADTVSVLDSHVFQDFDGRVYLIWKRDGPSGGQLGSLRMRELNPLDLTSFAIGSSEVTLLANAGGGAWEKNLEEAPWMIRRGGYYYLFYSGGFIDTSYAEGVARATSILGPYTRYTGNNPVLSSNSTWGGPGHGAFAQDVDGAVWFYYHARHQDNPNYGRVQMIDRTIWTSDSWPNFSNGGTPSTTQQTGPRVQAASGFGRYSIAGDAGGAVANDTMMVIRDAGDTSLVNVYLNGVLKVQAPFAEVENLTVDGRSGNDTLVLDYSRGDPVPGSGITFSGGNGTADTLRVIGASADDSFDVTAAQVVHGTGRVTWSGIERLSVQSSTFNINANLTNLGLDGSGSHTSILMHTAQTLASFTLSAGAAAVLDANGSHVLRTQTLSLSADARVDLNDNDLVVNAGAFTTIQSYVLSGYRDRVDPGAAGIISTTSQVDGEHPILALFDNALVGLGEWPAGSGNAVAGNAVIGRYTRFGDANLDGVVNGGDYGIVDANYLTTPSQGIGWISGDVNLDGIVNDSDYGIVDAANGRGAGNAFVMMSPASVPRREEESSPEADPALS